MKIKCELCDKEYSKKGMGTHVWRTHGEGKTFNSNNIGYLIGTKIAWNKGKTKDTDDTVKLMSEKNSKTQKGKQGKQHTNKTKDKISESRIKFLLEHPDQVPYLLNHSSKMSYPEMIFKNALESNNIIGWKYNYQNSIYQYDFAFLEQKIDVEIDGGTHLTEKVKKIDARRDKFSSENGWTVLRFTAKEVKENVSACIKKLNDLVAQLVRASDS